MVVGKFDPHFADSCWIRIVRLKVPRLQPQRSHAAGDSAHAVFHPVVYRRVSRIVQSCFCVSERRAWISDLHDGRTIS